MRNNIIENTSLLNPVTGECYAIVVKNKSTGSKNVIAFVAGAAITIAIPNRVYKTCEVGTTYKGGINLLTRRMESPRYIGKASIAKIDRQGIAKKGGNSTQSERQPIDAYLCRCKHDLVNNGIYLGSPEWDNSLDEATALYNAVNNTSYPRSIDTSRWLKENIEKKMKEKMMQ